MKVRAKQKCYYGEMIRQEGEEFEIDNESDLRSWLEPVEAKTKKPKSAPPILSVNSIVQSSMNHLIVQLRD